MPNADRAVLFVIDGLHPEAVRQVAVRGVRRLMSRGAVSLAAQTVMPSITLPTHMSMFHGVDTDTHGVQSNLYLPTPGEAVTGIVELARRSGRRTAAFYTWEELRDLWRPGAMVYSSFINIYGPEGHQSDTAIARQAADYLLLEQPDFTFVYLGLVDEIGHHYGWLSPEYLQAVRVAFEGVEHVLDQLESAGLLETTAVLLTADHGGHQRAHGSEIPDDMTIPWILAGPGVRQGCILDGQVRIYDTAPTLAHLLGLPTPPEWQGRVVTEAMEA